MIKLQYALLLLFTASISNATPEQDRYERGSAVTDLQSYQGLHLGVCRDDDETLSTDALFALASPGTAAPILAVPASLTSMKAEILSRILIPEAWDLMKDELRNERDRNGNAYMYRFVLGLRENTVATIGIYEAGRSPCVRSLPPGNPRRIICNPPILPADRGYGLSPMQDLRLTFRRDAQSVLLSKTTYVQNGLEKNRWCEWTTRLK